jgi:hypothetical protein
MSLVKKVPFGAEILDLVGARTARAEARAGQALPHIKIAGGYIPIQPEFDLTSSEALLKGDVRLGLERLLADPADVDLIMNGGLTGEDLSAIVKFVVGKTVGESAASVERLKSVGKG